MMHTLSALQLAHHRRQRAYPDCDDWTLADWGCALAGEAGEACNIVKKIRRGDSTPGLREALAKELGDVLAYTFLLATAAGINLEKAHKDKFNEINRRIGYAEDLT
jgi:NTP pyrophosphatase (non-canonical NTP hydrolase)